MRAEGDEILAQEAGLTLGNVGLEHLEHRFVHIGCDDSRLGPVSFQCDAACRECG